MSRSALRTENAEALKPDRIKLLIVDDDNVHRVIIKRFAKILDFDIAEAASFDRAVLLIDQEHFDCITLDLSLDARDGMDVLRHLWHNGRLIPVLIISGADDSKRSESTMQAELMRFNVLHVVKKPLDLQALREALTKLKSIVEFQGDRPV
ncbi:MAG TPA: response regulator [Xanthobacteraceae bacterium]|nr:response regulator [Xanthobacteraceae bacterium]